MKRNEAPAGNGGNASNSTSTKIPNNPATPWMRLLGCPAGCALGLHACGVGTPIPALPPDDIHQRGGRDFDVPKREYIGQIILDRQRKRESA